MTKSFCSSDVCVRWLLPALLMLALAACGGGSEEAAPRGGGGFSALTTEQLAQYQEVADRTWRLGPLFEAQVNEAFAGYYIGRSADNIFSFVLAVSDDRRVVAIAGELPDQVARVKYSEIELEAFRVRAVPIVTSNLSMDVYTFGISIVDNAIHLGIAVGATDRVVSALVQKGIPIDAIVVEEMQNPPSTAPGVG